MRRYHFLFLLCPLLPLLALGLDPHHAFLARDVSLVQLPAKRFWVESFLAHHSVPGWNPLAYGGIPFRADLNLSPLHPLNILFLLFPANIERGYLLFLGAHYLLLAIGAYWLFRRVRMGRSGALLAALAFSAGGAAASTINILNVAASFAALPYFFLFLLELCRGFSWFTSVGAAMAAVWPVYSGDPEFSYWMVLGGSLLVARAAWRERGFRPLWRALPAGLLALGLAAAQLLPALSLALASERGLGSLSLGAAERFSFHPARLLELLLPLPFGNPGAAEGYWLSRFTDSLFTMPFLITTYPGILTGLLLLVMMGRAARKRRICGRALFWSGGLILLSAFGRYSFLDLYALLFRLLPGWKMFRYPERLILPLTLVLIVWLAPAFRRLGSGLARGTLPKPALRWGGVLCGGAGAAWIAAWLAQSLELHTLLGALAQALLISGFAAWALALQGRIKPALLLACFCALTAADLLPVAQRLAWRTSADEVEFRQNTFAEKIHRNLEARAEEVKRGAAVRYFHGTYSGPFPTSATHPLFVGQAWDWGIMYPNIPMYFGIASAAGYGSFDPKDILSLWARYGQSDPQRLLDLFSIAYFPAAAGDRPGLKLNQEALPQVWLPEALSFRATPEEQEALLFRPDFPYRRQAVVSGQGREWRSEGAPWRIEAYERTPDQAVIRLRAGSPEAYLVWNERWNGNWTASSGTPLEVLRANTWAMAVHLKAETVGEVQTLTFRYWDFAAELGDLLTLGTLVLISLGSAGTLLHSYRRKKAPSHR